MVEFTCRGEVWVGNFAEGRADATGIYLGLEPDTAVIVSKGAVYIMDVGTRRLRWQLHLEASKVLEAPDWKSLVAAGESEIVRFDVDGILWSNGSFSVAGFFDLQWREDSLTGIGLDYLYDPVEFELDVNTGKSVERDAWGEAAS